MTQVGDVQYGKREYVEHMDGLREWQFTETTEEKTMSVRTHDYRHFGEEPMDQPVLDDDHPLNWIGRKIHTTAAEHGWWSDEDGQPLDRNMGEMLTNVHSEVSEAWSAWVGGSDVHTYEIHFTEDMALDEEQMRAFRSLQHWANSNVTEHSGEIDPLPEGIMPVLVLAGVAKPAGLDSELADVMIRVMDILYSRGVNIDKIVAEKMAFNDTRPYRHGGKRA